MQVAGKSEPRESGVVCLMCTRGTRGSRCHQCLNGYYNTTQKDGGGSQLNCTKLETLLVIVVVMFWLMGD